MDHHHSNQENNRLEWMLQSAEVDDAALTSALTCIYYAETFSFAYQLTRRQYTLAKGAAQAAIAAAVKERHRISLETSLRTWLFSSVYRRCRQPRPRLMAFASRLPFFSHLKTCSGPILSADLDGIPPQNALSLALEYGYGFTLQEAADIQEISEKEALNRLILSRVAAYKALYTQEPDPGEHLKYIHLLYREHGYLDTGVSDELREHMTACPTCRAYAGRLPELEERLLSEAGVTIQEFSSKDLESIIQSIMLRGGLQNHHRKRLPGKELGLVGVIIVTLLLFGNRFEIFTPYDARPTLTLPTVISTSTPTPGPVPPIVLDGEEGIDYFYYTFPVYNVETLVSLSLKTGLTQDEIRFLNQLEPGSPAAFSDGSEVRLVAFRDRGWFDPPPWSNERLHASPLRASSTVEEVLERYRETDSYWQTFWAEYVYIQSAEPGFLTPPEIVYIYQVWLADNELRVIAYEGLTGETFVIFRAGDWSFLSEDRGYQGMWDSLWIEMFAPYIGVDITTVYSRIDFEISQTGVIAGREAVSITGLIEDDRLELWFDARTGLVLGTNFGADLVEGTYPHLFANRVEYDLQFPPGLFYPPTSSVKGLSTSFRGDPTEDLFSIPVDWPNYALPTFIETRLSPPQDLDFTGVPLTFQQIEGTESPLEVFAGEYYLGSLEFPQNLWACQRSPDGQSVLLLTASDIFFSGGEQYGLLDLLTLEIQEVEKTPYGRSKFAFSPDSSRLAYVNCRIPCQLSILNLDSGQTEQIDRDLRFNQVQNLAWSPEGSQIAILFYVHSDPFINPFFVLDAESGEEILSGTYNRYLNTYDWTEGTYRSPGSPVGDWRPFSTEEEVLPCHKPVHP
jgi:DNA-directed RNA polymerase specialized sigma24 family protein